MKNIALSIEEDVLKAGRNYAKAHNISFNALVRKLIEQATAPEKDRWLEDCFDLMDQLGARSGDKKWSREELYRV